MSISSILFRGDSEHYDIEAPQSPTVQVERRSRSLRRVLKPGARLGITEELLFTSYQLAGSTRRWAEDAGFRFLAKTGSPICYHMVFANEK